tara:strand:- start:195 stop:1202 length:1008 start_codon:yes stop_codon:yes gene_type:complete
MIHELYLLLGSLVTLVIAYDFFYTTLSFNGAGYISRLLSKLLSTFFLFLNSFILKRKVLRYSGVAHLLSLMGLWIGLLWFGFFLLLMSDPVSVLEASTKNPASPLTKVYVSGYTLSTLGVGDYIPGTKGWQVIMAAFSFVGFIFVTTTMTYLMNLANAVIHKRNVSLFISNMGASAEEIIANSYDGNSFTGLSSTAPLLREMINKHNQNHLAHPGVHYFYSSKKAESLSINIANLDEALSTIFHFYKEEEKSYSELYALRKAINAYLDSIRHRFYSAKEHQQPHIPDFKKIHGMNNNIQIIDPKNLDEFQSSISDRRNQLLGLLKSDGWSWQDVG